MAHLRQQTGANDNGGGDEGRQDGGEGRSDRRLVDPWLVYDELWRGSQALERIAEQAQAQHDRSRSFTSMHTASVTQAGLLFRNLHLPEEAEIGSVVIENNSTLATLTVYEGHGGGGRVVGVCGPSHLKRIALANFISSVSIVASVADPAPALVIVTLSTHRWSPNQSTLT